VLDQTRKLVDYRLIQLDAIKGTARLAKRGMWIDAGSFTKGYVVDRAAQVLKKQGITQALITAGGTILALGSKTGGLPWRVGVRHPRKEGELLDTIPLEEQAISTSGDYERFYHHNNRRLCHIIDPRSGQPVEAVRSISVIAPTATASDALSTALFVLGTKEGLSLAKNLPGVEAMIVDQEGKVHCSPGWPFHKKER
jgi:thiamine biosynthesis lipoprotein